MGPVVRSHRSAALDDVGRTLVQQFEGLADWDIGGEDEEGDPKVIQFPKGGPRRN